MLFVSKYLKKLANNILWQDKIKDKFGISCAYKELGKVLDPIVLRQTFNILSIMPLGLVKDCKVPRIYFSSSMGQNRTYFPNHGYFFPVDKCITLNDDIFYHPDDNPDFYDKKGHYVDRPTQTLIHEMLHALDDSLGNISLKNNWLELSGWSPEPKKGLKRMIICEPGTPVKKGDWYYDPKAGFPRFYAKMNPEDDFADSGTFFLAGMKSKLPENKIKYFEDLFKKYT